MESLMYWPDAELVDVRLSYDVVTLTVQDAQGHTRHIHCEGYIKFEYDGAWDEIVISSGHVSTNDPYAQSAWDSIRARWPSSPPNTGSSARNAATIWHTLDVTFSDRSSLRCVAATFSID